MTPTVITNARRLDPSIELNENCDLLIEGGVVSRIGVVGAHQDWAETVEARVLAPEPGTELVVTPGLVDLHVHVFGGVGVPNVDDIGVRSAVPVVVDAGSAGTATIDDFVALQAERSSTQVLNFLSIESGGIVEGDAGHNTSSSPTRMCTPSMDDFLATIERHGRRIVGLKVWATTAAGLPWLQHATTLSELIERPLMVHVGEPRHDESTAAVSGNVLDHLGGGDIVTHCFTAQPGAIIDADGKIASEVVAARDRGVRFDVAPGLVNLSFDRAVRAMEQGWLPDILSTDLNRFCLEHPVRSLVNVLSAFMALGLTLEQVVERATTRPATAIGAPIGHPDTGQVATLSLLTLRSAASIFSDGSGGTVSGTERLEPYGCFIEGVYHEAGPPKAAVPVVDLDVNTSVAAFLREVERELTYFAARQRRWRGPDLHNLVHEVRINHEIPIAIGLEALHTTLSVDDRLTPAGWLLESLGPVESIERLATSLSS